MNYKILLLVPFMSHVLTQNCFELPRRREETDSPKKNEGSSSMEILKLALAVLPMIREMTKWSYRQMSPPLEDRAKQAQSAFEECLKTNADDPRNAFKIPGSCTEKAIQFALAREALVRQALGQPDSDHLPPRTQDIIDRFNATDF